MRNAILRNHLKTVISSRAMKNLTVTLSLENKIDGLEKVLNSVHKKVYEPCVQIRCLLINMPILMCCPQVIPVPRTDVEELKDIFREHGDSSSLAMRDVAANTELKQVRLVYK